MSEEQGNGKSKDPVPVASTSSQVVHMLSLSSRGVVCRLVK